MEGNVVEIEFQVAISIIGEAITSRGLVTIPETIIEAPGTASQGATTCTIGVAAYRVDEAIAVDDLLSVIGRTRVTCLGHDTSSRAGSRAACETAA